MREALVLALACLLAPPAAAQTVDELIARGDSLDHRLRPDSALVWYRRAVALDSTGPRQLWKVGHALVDIAKQLPDEPKSNRAKRDSMYTAATEYGYRALVIHNNEADAHFVVAMAFGRLALTKGGRDRLKAGKSIRWHCERALDRAPDHDGAHHVLGSYHAEIQRLSPVTRFLAKNLFGAKMVTYSNWDSAQVHLERAVAINPNYIYHRLDLARVLIDRKRWDEAKKQLAAVATLPPTSDVMDPTYKKEAEALLLEIRSRQ